VVPETDHSVRRMNVEPMFMTVPEVADLLRTSPKAIYTMIERGQLDGVRRLGRRVLIRRDLLLDSLLDHNCASSLEKKR
jgi:excisionase family DNA binding protein